MGDFLPGFAVERPERLGTGGVVRGAIDGAENNWPTYQSGGDYLVAPFYVLDQHTRVPEVLIASKIVPDRLNKADVEIIKQCAKETQEFEIHRWKEREVASEQIVRSNGNTIVELSSSAFAEFQATMQPLYAKYGSQYTDIIRQIQSMTSGYSLRGKTKRRRMPPFLLVATTIPASSSPKSL